MEIKSFCALSNCLIQCSEIELNFCEYHLIYVQEIAVVVLTLVWYLNKFSTLCPYNFFGLSPWNPHTLLNNRCSTHSYKYSVFRNKVAGTWLQWPTVGLSSLAGNIGLGILLSTAHVLYVGLFLFLFIRFQMLETPRSERLVGIIHICHCVLERPLRSYTGDIRLGECTFQVQTLSLEYPGQALKIRTPLFGHVFLCLFQHQ